MSATAVSTTEPLPTSLRAPARRQGHPLALAFWSALRDRSETDRRFVLAALEKARRAASAKPVRNRSPITTAFGTETCWAVFHRFASDPAAQSTFSKAYRSWHAGQPDKDELPSQATLCRVLGDGSWTTVLERAQLRFKADVTVRRLTALGAFFAEEEVVAGIKGWLESLVGRYRLSDFLAHSHEVSAGPGYTGPRLPLSQSPIQRLGGWPYLCGLADPDGALRQAALQRAVAAGQNEAGPRLSSATSSSIASPQRAADEDPAAAPSRGGRVAYTPQEATACLIRAQTEKGTWLTRAVYDDLARRWRKALLAAGERPRIPSARIICEVLELPWMEALAQTAGVEPGESSRFGQGKKRSDETLEDQVADAMDDLGEDPSLDAFRERRLALRAKGQRDLCGERTICNRLGDGSWTLAKQRVRHKRPMVEAAALTPGSTAGPTAAAVACDPNCEGVLAA